MYELCNEIYGLLADGGLYKSTALLKISSRFVV